MASPPDVNGRALTFTDFKVLEGQLGSRIVQEHFSVQCEHHGVLVQIHHAAHHVPRLPGSAKVLVTLVPALDLQRTSTCKQGSHVQLQLQR